MEPEELEGQMDTSLGVAPKSTSSGVERILYRNEVKIAKEKNCAASTIGSGVFGQADSSFEGGE